MSKCYFILVTLLLSIGLSSIDAIERRMAIDIGSGGTKVLIADIDESNLEIIDTIISDTIQVPYQASLDKSVDGTFDLETQELGLKAFKHIKDLKEEYEVKKVVAVATSAFRKANNSEQFIAKVFSETGLSIKVISQREEGEIAFYSASAASPVDRNEIIVWDIGTGSLQMTTTNENGDLIVYMGENMGSVAFKSYIIDVIQDKEIADNNTPNPISSEELKLADSYARAFGRKAYPIIKEKIKNNNAILGIGRLFNNSIQPLAANENGVIDRKGLRTYINDALEKSDEELNNPFAHVDVSNCILALAIMKSLHIQEITPVDTTSTQGILLTPRYWQS